jgi:hypothetical protein
MKIVSLKNKFDISKEKKKKTSLEMNIEEEGYQKPHACSRGVIHYIV